MKPTQTSKISKVQTLGSPRFKSSNKCQWSPKQSISERCMPENENLKVHVQKRNYLQHLENFRSHKLLSAHCTTWSPDQRLVCLEIFDINSDTFWTVRLIRLNVEVVPWEFGLTTRWMMIQLVLMQRDLFKQHPHPASLDPTSMCK